MLYESNMVARALKNKKHHTGGRRLGCVPDRNR